MRQFLFCLTLFVVAAAQAAVAPLFPVGASTFDFGIVLLVVTAAFAGTPAGLMATPAYGVLSAFIRGLSPAIVLLAYAPVVPFYAWLGEATSLPRALRVIVTTAGATGWTAAVWGFLLAADEANVSWTGVAARVAVPGAFANVMLATLAFVVTGLIARLFPNRRRSAGRIRLA